MRDYRHELQKGKLTVRGTAESSCLDMFKTQLSKFLCNLTQLHSWSCFSEAAGLASFHCFLPA